MISIDADALGESITIDEEPEEEEDLSEEMFEESKYYDEYEDLNLYSQEELEELIGIAEAEIAILENT